MEVKEIISALIAFLFGLIAKFIYDLWSERRKRKSLLIRKTVLTSFTLGSLEKDIREKLEVLYNHLPITSIQLVRVSMENSGSATIKNQAITIRFGDKAKIIGEPQSNSSSEDLRYIKFDLENPNQNRKRILFELLRKGAKISWDFAVINHNETDFIVEHGISKFDKESEDSDLDVISIITNEKTGLDVSGRVRNIIILMVFTQIVSLLRDAFVVGMPYLHDIATLISNILIITIWVFLIQEIARSVIPIMKWISEVFSQKEPLKIVIEGSVEESNIAVSTDNSSGISINSMKFDKEILRNFLKAIESPKKLPKPSSHKAQK